MMHRQSSAPVWIDCAAPLASERRTMQSSKRRAAHWEEI